MRLRSIVVCLLALAVTTVALHWGRPARRAEGVAREEDVALPPPTEPSPPASPSPLAAPAFAEVQPTLDRVFGQALAMDPSLQPAFVAGDFNGDDITDLAVAVRLRSASAPLDLNAEGTGCRTQDADHAAGRPEPAKAAARDLLLAVVHGVDAGGWRNPDARQCYLVKNAVGARMRPRPLAGMPDAIRMRVNRSHVGDVIVSSRGAEPGLLFWTGAAYVWADLEGEAKDW